jgi:diguanylate cyclase (GGDEF)-like protein/PAS domain S-box-containing protein
MTDFRDRLEEALRESPVEATLTLAASLCASALACRMAVIGRRDGNGVWTTYPYGLGDDWQWSDLPFIDRMLEAERLFVYHGAPAGRPPVQFAAAVPLRIQSAVVALVVVMDPDEKQFDDGAALSFRHATAVVRDLLFKGTVTESRELPDRLHLHMDLTGRIVRASHNTEQRLGYGPGGLVGRNLADIVEGSERGSSPEWFRAQLGSGGGLTSTVRLATAGGDHLLIRAHTRLAFDRGVPIGVDFAGQDITSEAVRLQALRRAEQALTAKAEELAQFSEHLRQLHRLATAEYSDIEELVSDYLSSGCEILRLPAGLVASLDENAVRVRSVHPANAPLAESVVDPSDLARALTHQGTIAIPEGQPERAPRWFGFECSISTPVYTGEELFGVLTFGSHQRADVRQFTAHEREVLELMAKSLGRSIYEDMLRGERSRLTMELARQARQDPLTGLSNRLMFMNQLESSLQHAHETGESLAVAFLDLDRFKQINDTLGHAVGDEILRQVGSRIASEVGTDDQVARVGGDEFTIVFRGNPSRDAVALSAQRLLDVLRAPYMMQDFELFITATIGICFFPGDAHDARDLLQKSDAAMYRAKSQGKNDFRFFTPDLLVRSSNRLELETQLRRALEKGELRLGFQPQVSVQGCLDSLEALLAWNNPRFGRVGASRFIPIAEESGMIIPIGAWVLREVCRQVAEWQSRGVPAVRVAINVSMLQFARPDFVETVARALAESGMPPQFLELELTESIIMRDFETSARRMSELREVGVSISIDDFGTGYSSLSYLRRLPVDALKIDRSFITELSSSGTSLPLIQTIVILAHNMGLAVVAEGVETLEQLEILRAIGCDKVQGHLFGEPLTVERAEALMQRPGRDVPLVG